MGQAEAISNTLAALAQTETEQDLTHIIYELRDRYEVAHLAYHAPRGDGSDVLLATGDAEFCSRYLERDAVVTDPVVREARLTGTPVDWDGVKRKSGIARRHFKELDSFDIGRRGMTIPCFGADGDLGLLSFSTNHSEDTEWRRFRDERAPELTYLGLYFHAAAARVTKKTAAHMSATLTPQGRRLLTLFAEGHTPAMIAQITGLSIRTVRMHLNNAQRRLACRTKAEVITKALNLGLVSINSRLLAAALVCKISIDLDFFVALSAAIA